MKGAPIFLEGSEDFSDKKAHNPQGKWNLSNGERKRKTNYIYAHYIIPRYFNSYGFPVATQEEEYESWRKEQEEYDQEKEYNRMIIEENDKDNLPDDPEEELDHTQGKVWSPKSRKKERLQLLYLQRKVIRAITQLKNKIHSWEKRFDTTMPEELSDSVKLRVLIAE